MSKLCYHCFPGFLLFREKEIVQWVCQPWVRVNVVLLLLSYPLPFFSGGNRTNLLTGCLGVH